MTNIKTAATEFLDHKRIAVTGVSRTPGDHGSNVVYKRLRDRGYQVFAVNPNADEVEGDPSYPDLASIPDGVEAVVIATRPERAEATMRRVLRARDPSRVDAPRLRGRQRLAGCRRVRSRARHHGDRRRLPADVPAHRRPRAPGDAARVHAHRQRAEAGLTGRARIDQETDPGSSRR
jgi:predicted CoA-binding protein